MPPYVLAAVLIGGFVAYALLLMVYRRWRKRRGLEQVRAILENGTLDQTGAVVGQLAGRMVKAEYVMRGDGSSSQAWTELTASHALPDIDLILKPQGLVATALGAIAKGVDIQIGDSRFDRAFIVEGAPATAIQTIFDSDTCRRLVDLAPLELVTKHGTLTIAKKKWLPGDTLVQLLGTAVAVAARFDIAAKSTPATWDREGEQIALVAARKRTQTVRTWVILICVLAFVGLWVLSVAYGHSD